MAVRVKICGVTNVEDAHLAVQAGADLIGLNFYPPSPRCVTESIAYKIRVEIPSTVWCIGVFVNAERQSIETLARRLALDAIQFHGDETTADLSGWSQKTIKALRVRPQQLVPQLEDFPADYLLLDTYRLGRYGGTGEAFSWNQFARLSEAQRQRIILAGGLNPDNVAAAVRMVQPWAVDVASGVEREPGKKDAEKMKAFIHHAKTA